MKRKMLFNAKIFAMAIIMTLTTVSCAQKEIIPTDKIPKEITSYVTQHFPNNSILQVEKELDDLKTNYDVILSENISLEFNRKKEIIEIEGNMELPKSVIPKELLQYAATNYPDQSITSWKIDDKNQEIELSNGLELKFKMTGDFLRIDN